LFGLFPGSLLVRRYFVRDVILVDAADVLNGLLADIFCRHWKFNGRQKAGRQRLGKLQNTLAGLVWDCSWQKEMVLSVLLADGAARHHVPV
jgi:hypothetical protein